MTFLSPTWLLLLVPVAVLGAAYVVLQRRRRHHAVRFTNVDLLASVAPSRPGWRRHLTAGVVGLGLVALVLALAGPTREHEVPRDEATVMLVVDTSASMAATDVDPSRLAAARAAAAKFVTQLPDSFEVGLVAFDGTARLIAPPSTDHLAVIQSISDLQTGEGTAAGDGLAVAVDTMAASLADGQDGAATAEGATSEGTEEDPAEADDDATVPGSIVVLSDGESTMGQPLEQATQKAVDLGVPVTTIAYGTPEGTVVVQGETVNVPADVEAMEAVAEATGGQAFTAASAEELASVLDDIETRIGTTTEPQDLDDAFVVAAVVVLMAAAAGSMIWNARFL